MRMPLNSPGSPAQWPAVSTTFGAMRVAEQRNAGVPFTSITSSTTAGCALPSTVPLVMNDGRPGCGAVGARSQPSRASVAAATIGVTRRALIGAPGGGRGSDLNTRLGVVQGDATALTLVCTPPSAATLPVGNQRVDIPLILLPNSTNPKRREPSVGAAPA